MITIAVSPDANDYSNHLGMTPSPMYPFFTSTKMRTSSVGTICINITGMVAIVALITIFKRN